MIVLGIDPGTRRVGYGVIKKDGTTLSYLEAGILNINKSDDPGALEETKKDLDYLIRKFNPELVAVEKIFFSKNRKTGIAVAQARGVILLAATEKGLPIKEFTPNAIKMALTGFGSADKKAILKMVRMTLKDFSGKIIDDASDALALAIVAAEEAGKEKKFSSLKS